ncbi:hypothetical protein ACE15N_05695 [Xanthomonas campestris pv. passiflorae]|uniref:hypothetical protein n=1 Tax=Xanthomonas campestris TaxID=339 RepID=UPI002428271F|nr:hypothetical protein [Xanthomonas campestris]MBV6812374.1 hypothetical protein [Xanthomonas campestris pv. passiflorae]
MHHADPAFAMRGPHLADDCLPGVSAAPDSPRRTRAVLTSCMRLTGRSTRSRTLARCLHAVAAMRDHFG